MALYSTVALFCFDAAGTLPVTGAPAERERERERARERDRDTQRERDTHREREREIHQKTGYSIFPEQI